MGGAVATILIAIVLIWLVLKLLGIAIKAVGLLILGGIAIVAYLAVSGKIGGPRA